ncbi:MAG: glycosyltransferase family 9 protein, partial [Chitinophagaceae bacterium]
FFFQLFGIKTISLDKQRSKRKLLLQDKKTSLTPMPQKYAEMFGKIGFVVDTTTPPAIFQKHQPLHIGFAPFASLPSKELSLSTTIELIANLLQKYPHAFLYLLGGMEDDSKIQFFPKHNHIIYLHKLPLKEQLLYIRKMDFVLSMDSANMHLASLYKIPVISVWCGTSPLAGFLGFGQNINNAIEATNLDCRPCSIFGTKNCSKKDFPCTKIPAQEILNHIEKVI